MIGVLKDRFSLVSLFVSVPITRISNRRGVLLFPDRKGCFEFTLWTSREKGVALKSASLNVKTPLLNV